MKEISAIQADLQRHIRIRNDADRVIAELQATLAVLARYGITEEGDSTKAPVDTDPPQRVVRKIAVGPVAVASVAAELMQTGPVWRPLSDLCEQIQATGTQIGGTDPLNNLSTIMSRNKLQFHIIADKRKGWALQSRAEQHDGLEGGGLLGKIEAK